MQSSTFFTVLALVLVSTAAELQAPTAWHHHKSLAFNARCPQGPQRFSLHFEHKEEQPEESSPLAITSELKPAAAEHQDEDEPGSHEEGHDTLFDEDSVPSGSTRQQGKSSSDLNSAKWRAAFTPANNKAGIAGGDAYPYFKDRIGWWYDWSPTPSKPGKPIAVPMLWGGGTADAQDAARLKAFKELKTVPKYILGFEEPDCPSGSGSAGMNVSAAVEKWESLIAPMKKKGARIGSPSMCKQADETWLAEFAKRIKTPWDFTAIHVNKKNLDGVKKDIEHYAKYGKPIWVTEFACVDDDPNFVPCTSQSQINDFIKQIVPYLESHPMVYAYAYSNGLGLGDVWPLMKGGKLSASGKTYLATISKFH